MAWLFVHRIILGERFSTCTEEEASKRWVGCVYSTEGGSGIILSREIAIGIR
jgi:hypothetical protein